MRIGIELTGALGGGGYRRYAEELLKAFALLPAAAEHDFFLYGSFWRDFPERARALDIPRARNFHWALHRIPQAALFPAEELAGLRFQDRLLAPLKLDLLHGLCSYVPPTRIPSVVTLHFAGRWDFTRPWDRLYFHRLPERSVRQARQVIAISEFCRAEALKEWDLPAEKVVVVPHGGPDAAFAPAHKEEEPLPGLRRPYVLFVGGTVPQKNPLLLAEAFARVKEERPALPHRLVFAGGRGGQAERLEAFFREKGLTDSAVFLGPVEHSAIHRLYQQASLLVCPSHQEGFAFPVLEGMACGAPVLGVDAGALPETIGDAGLLCAPEPHAMAAAMSRVLADDGLRAELARRGVERARTFSWQATAQKTLDVYSRIGASRR